MAPIVLAMTLLLAAPAARFNFLGAKQQTRAGVLTRAGEPEVQYDTFVEEGLLDPDIAPPYPGSVREAAELARARGHEMVEVEVFEYDLGEGLFAMVVFREGAVAYAVFPSPPSQTTAEAVESIYGRGEWKRIERPMSDHRGEAELLVFANHGVAFATDAEGALTRKLVWTPNR